jgi:acetyl esterase/lipase
MFSRSMATAMLFFCLAFLTARANAQQFTLVSNVPFCNGGGSPLLMDILLPLHRDQTPTPAVLWIHGGGWEHGDKNAHANAEFIANAGFVSATISYRLSDQSPFPAAIEDSKCAIRFLRANAAKYGIDPQRIGVAGSSAGGHLAELVATAGESAGLEGNGGLQGVSSKVQVVVSYFGVSDFTREFPQDTAAVIQKFLRGPEKEKRDIYRKASPIFYISEGDPPLLLVHGEEDDTVPFEQSVRMADAYRRAGLTVEFIHVQNADHDFRSAGDRPVTPSVETIHAKTVEFLKRYLADKAIAR